MSDVLDLTQDEQVDRAMTLLIAAAYGNPIVRRAVDQVEAEIRRLRAEIARLATALAEVTMAGAMLAAQIDEHREDCPLAFEQQHDIDGMAVRS